MKVHRNRKLLRAAASIAVYSVVKLPVVFVLMPSLVPFGHYDDSSDALAVPTYILLIEPVLMLAADFCSNRLVPDTGDDDSAPGVAKDDAVRGDPEAAGGKN